MEQSNTCARATLQRTPEENDKAREAETLFGAQYRDGQMRIKRRRGRRRASYKSATARTARTGRFELQRCSIYEGVQRPALGRVGRQAHAPDGGKSANASRRGSTLGPRAQGDAGAEGTAGVEGEATVEGDRSRRAGTRGRSQGRHGGDVGDVGDAGAPSGRYLRPCRTTWLSSSRSRRRSASNNFGSSSTRRARSSGSRFDDGGSVLCAQAPAHAFRRRFRREQLVQASTASETAYGSPLRRFMNGCDAHFTTTLGGAINPLQLERVRQPALELGGSLQE